MPRESERHGFLKLYVADIIQQQQMLDNELDIDIELETLALEDVMDESDTSTTTTTTTTISVSSTMSTSASLSSSLDSLEDSSLMDFESSDFSGGFDSLLTLVLSHRYLLERQPKLKSNHYITTIVLLLDDYDFKEEFRMFPESFRAILARIENHSIFYAEGTRNQAPPELQLKVTLR